MNSYMLGVSWDAKGRCQWTIYVSMVERLRGKLQFEPMITDWQEPGSSTMYGQKRGQLRIDPRPQPTGSVM